MSSFELYYSGNDLLLLSLDLYGMKISVVIATVIVRNIVIHSGGTSSYYLTIFPPHTFLTSCILQCLSSSTFLQGPVHLLCSCPNIQLSDREGDSLAVVSVHSPCRFSFFEAVLNL